MDKPEKKKRRRIIRTIGDVVHDEKEFKPNCASKNAKLIHEYKEFEVELHIDKHYETRLIHGDDEGKREGIDEDLVKALIIKSFKYLVDIALRNPHFRFITYFDRSNPIAGKRLVLRDIKTTGILNVVIEVHYVDVSKFEVTAFTAMQVDDFKIADGQYVLSFSDKSGKVNLTRKVNKSIENVYSLDL